MIVDVAIRTIGPAPFLAEAVASVVAQTHSSWRLVVSEDDSEPGPAGELVAPFLEDPRVRFVSTPARRNAAAHQTQLVRAGSAPYVAVLDDDDRWDTGFLERRVGFMERHPKCAFVFSSSRVIDARGRELATNDPRLEEGVHDGRRLIGHLLRRGNVITSSSALVRRAAYGPDVSYDTRFVVGYDLEMWVRLAARWAVGYLDKADIEYRLHPGQVTQARPDCRERVRLLDHIEDLLAQSLPDVRFDAHYPRRRRAQCLLGAALDAAESGDAVAARAHWRRAITTHPIASVHPASAAVLAAAALGQAGPRALGRARSLVRRVPRPLEGHERAKAMGRLRLRT